MVKFLPYYLSKSITHICSYCNKLLETTVHQFCQKPLHITFTTKMHQIQFWLGFRPRPQWWSLQRSPSSLAVYKWLLLWEGRGRKGRGGSHLPRWLPTNQTPKYATGYSYWRILSTKLYFLLCFIHCMTVNLFLTRVIFYYHYLYIVKTWPQSC